MLCYFSHLAFLGLEFFFSIVGYCIKSSRSSLWHWNSEILTWSIYFSPFHLFSFGVRNHYHPGGALTSFDFLTHITSNSFIFWEPSSLSLRLLAKRKWKFCSARHWHMVCLVCTSRKFGKTGFFICSN